MGQRFRLAPASSQSQNVRVVSFAASAPPVGARREKKMGVLTTIAEAHNSQRPGQTLDQRQLLHLSDKPGDVRSLCLRSNSSQLMGLFAA